MGFSGVSKGREEEEEEEEEEIRGEEREERTTWGWNGAKAGLLGQSWFTWPKLVIWPKLLVSELFIRCKAISSFLNRRDV